MLGLAAFLPSQVPSYAKGLPKPEPVFALGLDGSFRVRGEGMVPKLRAGTGAVRAAGYTGFGFDGVLSGIELGDPPALRLTKSLSIASWIRLDAYTRDGLGAQVVFRGDERIGLDPYSLTVLSDGKVYLSVQNAKGTGDNVSAPVPLGHWTHVLGSLDDRSGEITLWIDGAKVASHITKIRPFGPLDPNSQPGVSIGNIQTQFGNYNQPLAGSVADVRIYDRAVTPAEIHLSLEGWDRPIRD